MERIKRIEELVLQENYLLLELVVKKSLIIKPNGKTDDPELDFAKVIAKHPNVTDIEVGDIVVKAGHMIGFEVGEDDEQKDYAIIPRVSCLVTVKPDNFDPDLGKKGSNNKSELKA